MTVIVVCLKIMYISEASRTKFALKQLFFLEEQEVRLKRIELHCVESHAIETGSFVGSTVLLVLTWTKLLGIDCYRVNSKMSLKSDLSSKALAAGIARERFLLEIVKRFAINKQTNKQKHCF